MEGLISLQKCNEFSSKGNVGARYCNPPPLATAELWRPPLDGSTVCATQVRARFLSVGFLWVRPTRRVFSLVFTVGLDERRSEHERQSAGRARGDHRCTRVELMSAAHTPATRTQHGSRAPHHQARPARQQAGPRRATTRHTHIQALCEKARSREETYRGAAPRPALVRRLCGGGASGTTLAAPHGTPPAAARGCQSSPRGSPNLVPSAARRASPAPTGPSWGAAGAAGRAGPPTRPSSWCHRAPSWWWCVTPRLSPPPVTILPCRSVAGASRRLVLSYTRRGASSVKTIVSVPL